SGKECLTGKGIKIGIIDTGVDYTHKDLGGCFGNNCKVAGGYDFVNKDNDPKDDNGHGTHVAATAAGNGILKGVAPDATIYAYKVLNAEGSGKVSGIIASIERSIDLNQNKIPCENKNDYLDIISLSLGGGGDPDDPPSTAIDNAAVCTVAVISAGNSGPNSNTIGSPGTARKAITVGATYKKDYDVYKKEKNVKTDQVTYFSSRGPVEWNTDTGIKLLIKPDITAPGAIICAAQMGNAWNNKKCESLIDEEHVQISGTSMAAPHVSGAVALLKQKNPDWKPEEIKTALKNTAQKLIDPATGKEYPLITQGHGRLDIQSAINFKGKPSLAYIKTSGIVKGIIDIIGTVGGEQLKNYKLYYKDEKNQIWIEIASGTNPVTNAVLYAGFDTSQFTGDYNQFKLEAFNSFEEKSEYYSLVTTLNDSHRQITISKDSQFDPVIYENIIVWTDNRNNENYDIYMYDLLTNKEIQVTTDHYIQVNPSIYENKIVYIDSRNEKYDVYLYDLEINRERQITNNPSIYDFSPAIYENKIVFTIWDPSSSNDNYVMMYDLQTNKTKIIAEGALSQNANTGQGTIFKNKVVYSRKQNIFLYDLTTDTERQLTYSGSNIEPSIDNNSVVWLDPNTQSIRLYDLLTNKTKIISTDVSISSIPAVSGNRIVYHKFANRQSDIYMYDLITNTEKQITNNFAWQLYPKIYGNKIVWEDRRYGNRDIFMYEIPQNVTRPVCGNNKREGTETCDGSDAASCPGQCTAQCTCPALKPQCSDTQDNDADGKIDGNDKGCWTNVNDPLSYNPNDNDESDEILNSVQSKIVNNNKNATLIGNLQIKLQKKINGNFIFVSTVVNQSASIPANGLLKLDTGKDNLGNQVFTGFNTLNVKADSVGDYRVYARFEKNGQFVESNWEFMVG
ncbi:MAG: S8 family serine peptidase, partial [Nanoarchaeota archaeon]